MVCCGGGRRERERERERERGREGGKEEKRMKILCVCGAEK